MAPQPGGVRRGGGAGGPPPRPLSGLSGWGGGVGGALWSPGDASRRPGGGEGRHGSPGPGGV